MTDPTEAVRRAMLAGVPDELAARIANGEQIWDTEQMQTDFEAIGFAAPFIAVRRRSDGVKGSLMFTHRPRFYFGWQED